MPRLTKRFVENIAPGAAELLIWDSELRGFGVRVTAAGVRSYIVQYRTDARRSRRMTIGRHGVITLEDARTKALKILASVADGADPMAKRATLRGSATVAGLLDRHMAEHVEIHNSAATLASARDVFTRYVRPALGTLKIESVNRQDVAKLHLSMKDKPRQANLTLAHLSKAFSNAELWGLRPDGSNPCRRIKRYPENHRERFLSPAELARLGAALREAETEGLPWPDDGAPKSKHTPKPENRRTIVAAAPLAIIRTLLLTGARLSEICELQWSHVDLDAGTLKLPGKKGGERKTHPVGAAALELLATIARVEDSPWVFPRPNDPKRHVSKEVVENAWQRLRWRAGIEDVRLHDLRHTVGTFASQAGVNAFMVRDLLRHASTAMTNRYVNFDAAPVREVSNTVAQRISAGLDGKAAGEETATDGKY